MPRTIHRLAVALALLAAVGLLVPTAATQFLPTQPADDLGNQVHLQPADGANGAYASLADGELVIDVSSSNPSGDVEGVDPGTVTHLEDVFVVHYNGSEYAAVWLTHEGEGLTFTASGHPVDSRDAAITLGPNETATVGLLVDTTNGNDVEEVEEFTVHARAAEPDSGEEESASGGWWSGSADTATESGEDGESETTDVPTTATDVSDPTPTESPGDTAGATAPGTTASESADDGEATVTRTGQDGRASTMARFTERAAGLSGGALGTGIVALLVALAVVVGGRRGP